MILETNTKPNALPHAKNSCGHMHKECTYPERDTNIL